MEGEEKRVRWAVYVRSPVQREIKDPLKHGQVLNDPVENTPAPYHRCCLSAQRPRRGAVAGNVASVGLCLLDGVKKSRGKRRGDAQLPADVFDRTENRHVKDCGGSIERDRYRTPSVPPGCVDLFK